MTQQTPRYDATAAMPVPVACDLVHGVAAAPGRDDFDAMLDALDERVQAFVVDDRYACSLTPAQWGVLTAALERNAIPIVLETRVTPGRVAVAA
jgi:hypothetical protein